MCYYINTFYDNGMFRGVRMVKAIQISRPDLLNGANLRMLGYIHAGHGIFVKPLTDDTVILIKNDTATIVSLD